MDYRFHLRKGGKKLICPACGDKRKTFVPYVDVNNNIVDINKYGRCERINNCGYTCYPRTNGDKWEWEIMQRSVIVKPKPVEYVSKTIVEATFHNFKHNPFFMFLARTFGMETAYELQAKYNIGTATNGGTIFWQQDKDDNFRTGKVIYYNPTGKRNHDRKSWFVHSKISPDFVYQQCFFGLHLADETKPIALCESEKTAVMMSVFQPEFNWLASGGSEMLNNIRLSELPRLDKVFADNGQTEKWEMKTRNFDGRKMDASVDNAVADGLIPPGSDVLDLVLVLESIKKQSMTI